MPPSRVPVVGGLGYVERVRRLPSSFTAVVVPEPENRYYPNAVAVLVNGEKVGYLPPEISRRYFEPLKAMAGLPPSCPGRHATPSDRQSFGVELVLDFGAFPVQPVA